MDATEQTAVHWLAARGVVAIDELPPTIDLDVLRCLDDAGLIEARLVTMQNRAAFPGDPTPPAPTRHAWFSPIRSPTMAGGWDRITSERDRDRRNHPAEIRLTERGLAELAREQRRGRSPDPSAPSDGADAPPLVAALDEKERNVLHTLASFDASRLATVDQIIKKSSDAGRRVGDKKVRATLKRFIAEGWAERSGGDKGGAHLTLAGRRLAKQIAE